MGHERCTDLFASISASGKELIVAISTFVLSSPMSQHMCLRRVGSTCPYCRDVCSAVVPFHVQGWVPLAVAICQTSQMRGQKK